MTKPRARPKLSERPLGNLKIDELEAEFIEARATSDAARLVRLRDELACRRSPRAVALAARVSLVVAGRR